MLEHFFTNFLFSRACVSCGDALEHRCDETRVNDVSLSHANDLLF